MNAECKIIIDERGYLRVQLPDGNLLPETSLTIENTAGGNPKTCLVTVTFEATHDLKNNEVSTTA